MPTKVSESCKLCGISVVPTDKAMAVEYKSYDLVVKFWRYVCGCSNVWANLAQRQHNDRTFNQAIDRASNALYM